MDRRYHPKKRVKTWPDLFARSLPKENHARSLLRGWTKPTKNADGPPGGMDHSEKNRERMCGRPGGLYEISAQWTKRVADGNGCRGAFHLKIIKKSPDPRWTTLHSVKTFTGPPACHGAFHEILTAPPWRHGPFHEKNPRTPWRHGPFHEKCPRTPVAEWSIPIFFPAGPPFGMVHSVSFSPPEHPPGLVHPRELSGGIIHVYRNGILLSIAVYS